MAHDGIPQAAGVSGEPAVLEAAIWPESEKGKFRVEVRSPAGGASVSVVLSADALLARLPEVESAVLASASSLRRATRPTERPIREIGEALFTALLGSGKVAEVYRTSVGVAAAQEQPMRVVLRIEDPRLSALPWEAMYDVTAGGYVCRRQQLVRHVPVQSVLRPLAVDPPLRILAVLSLPVGVDTLRADEERRLLEDLVADGLAEVTWAPEASWAGLQEVLLAGPWHVVHFVGHGGFVPDLDEGVLVLVGENGREHPVVASQFVDLLGLARPIPRLVVLNCCSGAVGSAKDLFAGIAAALTRAGVPAVVAMQFEITDVAAAAFARGFYTAIAKGRAVDDAVSAGRIAILGKSNQTVEWVTPVMYLRGQQARLFTGLASLRNHNRSEEQVVQSGPTRTTSCLVGHKGDVNAVAFSSDGALLATASADKSVRLWDLVGGTCLRGFTEHTDIVLGVVFSPDDSVLASCGSDRTARLWNRADGSCLRTLTGHTDYVRGAAFSPDAALLATCGSDGTVRLWDVADGTLLRTLYGHRDVVCGVAFSPDGALLATGSWDRTVRLWDPADGSCLRTLNGHGGFVRAVAFSPDGAQLASASNDRSVRLWDPAEGAWLRALTGHTDFVRSVAFSPDGALLATASDDSTVRLWDPGDGSCLRTLSGHADIVVGVAFSPDSTLLATASWDDTVRLWQ